MPTRFAARPSLRDDAESLLRPPVGGRRLLFSAFAHDADHGVGSRQFVSVARRRPPLVSCR